LARPAGERLRRGPAARERRDRPDNLL